MNLVIHKRSVKIAVAGRQTRLYPDRVDRGDCHSGHPGGDGGSDGEERRCPRARARAALRPLDDPRRHRSLQRRRRPGAFRTKLGSENYPPDLDTLVKGEDVGGKKLKFLRKIPLDPMTKDEWGLRSMQDDKDSTSWGGQNVFDVYSKSDQTALDGTKYKDW